MKIIFRADGSHKRGMGHIYRSISLAKQFPRKDVIFILRPSPVAEKKIKQEKYKFLIAKSDSQDFKLLNKYIPDIVITDILNTKIGYMKKLKTLCKCLVTIDDEGKGNNFADLIFNILYNKKTKADNKRIFTSPTYQILNKKYAKYHNKTKKIKRIIKNILITQGGADTANITPKIINALKNVNLPKNTSVHVVVGPAFKKQKELKKIRLKNKIIFHKNIPSLDPLIFRADIAITSCGVTPYEIASVGTPMIITCQNKMETETAKRFGKNKAAINLGDKFIKKQFLTAVTKLIKSQVLRENMSMAQRKYISPRGAQKIKNLIISKVK